ncbi:MAG TPA: hypothetical protein VFT74_10850 [Isosphaeraceae bacterium]|nr:hypothetical protein [Isosphaeraceae bacterium]
MTILFDATAKVNRVNRPFALGLTRDNTTRRVGYTAADAQWAAENLNQPARVVDARLNAEVDRMAEEAAWQDAYEAGVRF